MEIHVDNSSTTCKYGDGTQDITTCKMIYIHWPGYYPGDLYLEALKILCPNCKNNSYTLYSNTKFPQSQILS